MYYDVFESYEQALAEASSFRVVVELTDKTVVESSAIPISEFGAVQAEVMSSEGGWVHLWNRDVGSVVSVPIYQIKHVKMCLINEQSGSRFRGL